MNTNLNLTKMKTKAITLPTGNIFDPNLEEMLRKRDAEIKILAERNAKNFAQRNLPTLIGDNLSYYIAEIKAGYEKLATEVFNYLQPQAHFPEAKIDLAYFKEKQKNLETEVNTLEAENQNDIETLRNHEGDSTLSRIIWAMVSTIIITVGEIAFNTKAFQVTGESLLFALVLSICVSVAVFVFAHITPMFVKEVKTRMHKIMVISGSLLLVSLLFIALAIFRSTYLLSHDVHVQPAYFVIINIFFFIVSALVSFFILPSWTEIKENAQRLKIEFAMKKRAKVINTLKAEIQKINEILMERDKIRIRIAFYANYVIERIKKMYLETVGAFKTANLMSRNDNTPPDCFKEEPPAPEIETFYYSIIENNSN